MNLQCFSHSALRYGLVNSLIVCSLFLVGCGGGSSSKSGSATITNANNVINASSQSACQQAGNNDQSVCFFVAGQQANMYGVIKDNTPDVIKVLTTNYPSVTEIVMHDVPGSDVSTPAGASEDNSLRSARLIRAANLNTRVLSTSDIASGGVDFFVAGVQRFVENGAKLGVHSWAGEDGSGTPIEGAALPTNDPQHQQYINYFTDMGLPNPSGFYFFTLNAASSANIHNMSNAEMLTYSIPTGSIITSSAAINGTVSLEETKMLGQRTVQLSGNSHTNIIGDQHDNIFHGNAGVNEIDGKGGIDTVIFQGLRNEYAINKTASGVITQDGQSHRDGINVLKNIEVLQFKDQKVKTENL